MMARCNENSGHDFAHVEAALDYLKHGWAVVPAGKGAKRPIVRWQRFQHQMPDEKLVKGWYQRWPEANIAIVTGEISGIVVIDIDPVHGGTETLAEMERRHGALPATVEAVTGGGGRHIYFAHPGHEVHSRVALAPGIDIRGDGGCIIVPPSTHPSGRRYRWVSQRAPGQIAFAPLPGGLEQPRFSAIARHGHPLAYWRALVQEGVQEGRRNSTIASFAGHLLWHGVDADVAMELLLTWNKIRCRPPLCDEEVIGTFQSVERTHRRQRFEHSGKVDD